MSKKMFPAFIVVLVLIVATTISASAVPQPSAPAQAEDEIVVHQNPNPGRDALSWSPEALSNALPMPLGVKEGAPEQQTQKVQLSSGTLHTSPPARPGPVVASVNSTSDTSILVGSGFEQPYPPMFTSFTYFGRGNLFPSTTYGTLFFTQNGISYRCSGVLVYRNVVFTAGHCLHDGSNLNTGWSTDIVFYPAYFNGPNPWYTPNTYSNWVSTYVRNNWYTSEEYGDDFGAIVFDNTNGGSYPGDVYGYSGFQTGFSEVQSWAVFGYPAEPPFGGNQANVCYTSYSRVDTSTNPDTVGFGCNFTGGSSGGPLVRKLNAAGGAVNGVISYVYNGFANEMYSPYFGDGAWSLYCAAAEDIATGLDHPQCP